MKVAIKKIKINRKTGEKIKEEILEIMEEIFIKNFKGGDGD